MIKSALPQTRADTISSIERGTAKSEPATPNKSEGKTENSSSKPGTVVSGMAQHVGAVTRSPSLASVKFEKSSSKPGSVVSGMAQPVGIASG